MSNNDDITQTFFFSGKLREMRVALRSVRVYTSPKGAKL